MVLQTIEAICIFFAGLLVLKAIWVLGVSTRFAQLHSQFHQLYKKLPENASSDPFGRKLQSVFSWHLRQANLRWGKIVFLLGRARFNENVQEALGDVYLAADAEHLPYVVEYERLVYTGLCYHAPILTRIFLRWYTQRTGRLFLALESYQEVRGQEEEEKAREG